MRSLLVGQTRFQPIFRLFTVHGYTVRSTARAGVNDACSPSTPLLFIVVHLFLVRPQLLYFIVVHLFLVRPDSNSVNVELTAKCMPGYVQELRVRGIEIFHLDLTKTENTKHVSKTGH